jgi:hypothetical protein
VRHLLPSSAREILERGVLCHLGVRTSLGPHLTPVVFALRDGRLWVTTSRRSIKARSWRADPSVAGMVAAPGGEAWVTFRGHVRTHDALDPFSWVTSTLAAPRLVRAATRFSAKNARFFAGYAVDARRVPLAWTPPARVFAEIRLMSGNVLSSEGAVVERWGEWSVGSDHRRTFAPLRPGRPIDRRVPREVRDAVGSSGSGALAVQSDEELTVLPARWRRMPSEASYDAVTPGSFLDLARATPQCTAALTMDRPSAWRASEMTGVLVQGRAQSFSLRDTTRGRRLLLARLAAAGGGYEPHSLALIRIRPSRVVWWQGWTSGSARTLVGRGPRRDGADR